MTDREKAKAVRDAMSNLAAQLQSEKNPSAAQLLMSACCEVNTLLDRDAARLFDLINRHETRAEALAEVAK